MTDQHTPVRLKETRSIDGLNTERTLMYLFPVFLLIACSNVGDNKSITENKLADLLKNKDFFRLRKKLNTAQDKTDESRWLYYKAHCEQAFDNGIQSNEYADLLLSKYKKQLNDTSIVELLTVKATNCIRRCQYKKAADIYSTLLERYHSVLDSSEISNYRNSQQLFGTLELVKPQVIHRHSAIEIATYRNRFNHLMVPVKCAGHTDEFIFDTGANLSTVSAGYATKMGMTVFESDIEVGSSTNITVQTKLAVADSLYVGDILFEHVAFLVIEDEHLSFPALNYQIHGIIGFPVIHQMGEIRMHKDGTIGIPEKAQYKKLHNMLLEGLNPVVQLISNNDTLFFTLDTGAKTTELSHRYYERHKDKVEKNGKLETAQRGGAGRVMEVKQYELQNFPFTVGTKSSVLPDVPVLLSEYSFNKDFDGNTGQDIFMQFNDMILNFEHMYIDFE